MSKTFKKQIEKRPKPVKTPRIKISIQQLNFDEQEGN
jgi:hypothetical protein